MSAQTFRILRVLTGTREFIDAAIGGRSVKGSMELRTGTIREVILHETPELISATPETDLINNPLPDIPTLS